ncbi:MAG TPA: hypothetical protein VFL14_07485 [Xanthomonadales bacterium]|nr:hypothetical protein [Xanthomonadales bacterium]
MTTAHTYLTALSPIEYRADDPQGNLAAVREALRRHEQRRSPFKQCPMVHMVRLQVIDKVRPPIGAQRAAPLQSSYLLLAAELDGSVDDFLDCLHRVDSGFVRNVWGRCIGYPRYDGAVFLRRYIARCTLRGELPYAAFGLSVGRTLEALALKERLSDFVAAAQGLDAARLQQEWQRQRQGLVRTGAIPPGSS